ncbi:dUTP diphosphatase [Spiroplasma endosymbiont of Othius punctulatus]|uniref:dUTP diphosphatase n=1 Tax=Spiroplasma endosymbiont of Othius punctulatus TaxID=3066289 RepID=UPI0030D58E73
MIKNTELVYLSEKQSMLDNYIIKSKQITVNDDVKKKKRIAFMVELFEFINEEKSFKYWSNKRNINQNDLIEEFIDGIHFIISIGNDLSFNFNDHKDNYFKNNIDDCIIDIIEKFNTFNKKLDTITYDEMLTSFLNIGFNLNFQTDEILKIYNEKNKKNFERQDNGY